MPCARVSKQTAAAVGGARACGARRRTIARPKKRNELRLVKRKRFNLGSKRSLMGGDNVETDKSHYCLVAGRRALWGSAWSSYCRGRVQHRPPRAPVSKQTHKQVAFRLPLQIQARDNHTCARRKIFRDLIWRVQDGMKMSPVEYRPYQY